eukprot:RCo050208
MRGWWSLLATVLVAFFVAAFVLARQPRFGTTAKASSVVKLPPPVALVVSLPTPPAVAAVQPLRIPKEESHSASSTPIPPQLPPDPGPLSITPTNHSSARLTTAALSQPVNHTPVSTPNPHPFVAISSVPSSNSPAVWDVPIRSEYPKLALCMTAHQRLPETSLPRREELPTLIFIKYPASNILENMFRAVRNLSRVLGGFAAVRNREAANVTYRIVVNFEEPNGMFIEVDPAPLHRQVHIRVAREAGYSHSLTMCPYTAAWVNRLTGLCKRTPMWQAVPRELIPRFLAFSERKHDVMFMSSQTNNGPVEEALVEVFPQFVYRWVSNKRIPKFRGKVRVTDYRKGVAHRLRVTQQSRAALIVNCLFFNDPAQTLRDWRKRPILYDHPAFKLFPRWNPGQVLSLPQIKSRTFEAAMCGALMLVYNDGMNVIEMFYEPEKEFVYWHNTSDLLLRMRDVLARPQFYQPIAWRAYNKTRALYTTENWVRLLMQPFVEASRRHRSA